MIVIICADCCWQLVEVEEEFVAMANSDIAQLCAENILLWQQFLEAFSCKDPVHQHLARHHHHLRVKQTNYLMNTSLCQNEVILNWCVGLHHLFPNLLSLVPCD
jgi:hypothetical protein